MEQTRENCCKRWWLHKSEKLHPAKICGEAALREGFPPQATAEPVRVASPIGEGCVTLA
ncbi:hypothetical protein [uncultured Nostoc sp.]|uniref:hypothetical protein n=1 Tax=uncultured Nostoc sp. TaxID=340711 RepID=UPI0035CBC12D